MGLVPALQVNFDGGGGLADTDDYVLDSDGVGHFHMVKAGSTWAFDLVFTGVDTTAVSWAMKVKENHAQSTAILDSAGSGAAAITITPNPTGSDNERVRFRVAPAGTSLLQSNGVALSFVYDIEASAGGDTDRWVFGTGQTTPEVTD